MNDEVIILSQASNNRLKQVLGLGGLALLLFVGCLAASAPAHADMFEEWYSAEQECDPDVEGSLAQAQEKGHVAFQAGLSLSINSTYRNHKTNNFASCMIKIIDYYDKIKLLLSTALGMLAAIILGLLTAILNWACQYVVGSINALLAAVCLPMPRIGIPALNLPGIPSASCDGLSLLNLMQAQGTFTTNIPYSGATHGMSLGLDQLIKTGP